MSWSPRPTTAFFAAALQGEPCSVHGIADEPVPLPTHTWRGEADPGDQAFLAHCRGATLDVGCGPGRLTAALEAAGHLALGIDVVAEAVDQTVRRGATALHRDVFEPLPREGRWRTALLADGNVGIGGDPVALLGRVRELLDPHGRVVVEVAPPGVRCAVRSATLECGGQHSPEFPWAVVGYDGVGRVAEQAGLTVVDRHAHGRRWCALLEQPR